MHLEIVNCSVCQIKDLYVNMWRLNLIGPVFQHWTAPLHNTWTYYNFYNKFVNDVNMILKVLQTFYKNKHI